MLFRSATGHLRLTLDVLKDLGITAQNLSRLVCFCFLSARNLVMNIARCMGCIPRMSYARRRHFCLGKGGGCPPVSVGSLLPVAFLHICKTLGCSGVDFGEALQGVCRGKSRRALLPCAEVHSCSLGSKPVVDEKRTAAKRHGK